jgi:hypothetical protein
MFCRLNHSDGLSVVDTIAENAEGQQGIQIVNDPMVSRQSAIDNATVAWAVLR